MAMAAVLDSAPDSSARGIAVENAANTIRILKGVDRLPDGATGALLFGNGDDDGHDLVLVENRRICWATASGMDRRLTDLLIEEAGGAADSSQMEALYERCHAENRPLGETLVEEGIVSADGLRRSLLHHTAEAVVRLGSTPELSPRWKANRRQRYDAAYTFGATELLARVGALGREETVAPAEATLHRVLKNDGSGAAFHVESRSFPIAEVRGDLLGVEGLVALGRWSFDAFDRCREFDPDCNLVVARAGVVKDALGMASWVEGNFVYAVAAESASALGQIVARRRHPPQ